MANRIRNERLEIKLTEEEKALFEEKRTAETEGE
jgi:putative conjugative transposon mobilization protein